MHFEAGPLNKLKPLIQTNVSISKSIQFPHKTLINILPKKIEAGLVNKLKPLKPLVVSISQSIQFPSKTHLHYCRKMDIEADPFNTLKPFIKKCFDFNDEY